jgi:hypothetical protein
MCCDWSRWSGYLAHYFKSGAALLLVFGLAACSTVPPLPQADLKAPGWTVREGQAVWHRPNGGPEVAGEILLATRENGRAFVQFSKNGFPLLVAQTAPGRWQAEVPAENERYSGRGQPPARLLILYLPRALAGQPLPAGWSWETSADGNWTLANKKTGESLQGYFTS